MGYEKTDGRGILAATYLDHDREITRDIWLHEAFPEWGTFLNQEIENYEVPKGSVEMWYGGGASWVLKTDEGGICLIDQYAGGSRYTVHDDCGVCKQCGAPTINWFKMIPQVLDPFAFTHVDGVFCTHVHGDHTDIYVVKGTMASTEAKYYAPPIAANKLREFGVPEARLNVCNTGDKFQIPGAEIEILVNYDQTAIRHGEGSQKHSYSDSCCSFLFKTSAGNILFMGDTWFHDAYAAVGAKYNIDVAIFDMGFNAPGETDKMDAYDAARLCAALKTKVAIPDHWDNWANSMGEPGTLIDQFEYIMKGNSPEIKTVIMRPAGRFEYPKDQDIKRYRYPDQRENFDYSKAEWAGLK